MDLASTKTAPEMRGYVNIHCKIAGYWQREERNSNGFYVPASPSQYTAFGQWGLLQRTISGAFLAQMKSSAYEDLGVTALRNSLVAVSD